MALNFHPPLCNSASLWATTYDDLLSLYQSPCVGAVTTRTALIEAFDHDDRVNQHVYFDARANVPLHKRSPNANSTLNTLGYSPFPLATYLEYIERIVSSSAKKTSAKTFIVSVTGSVEDVIQSHRMISAMQRKLLHPILMEINLSCPNISNKPPPAYDASTLAIYLAALQNELTAEADATGRVPAVPIGIKTPPYTYSPQFGQVIGALLATITKTLGASDDITRGANLLCPISFITATNTLGSCLVLSDSSLNLPATSTDPPPPSEIPGFSPAIASTDDTGIGGLGGAALHPISLGNVKIMRRLLDAQPGLRHIQIIGVGGVSDYGGYERMKSVGATVVGIGSALGRMGLDVFENIIEDEKEGRRLFGGASRSEAAQVLSPTATPNGASSVNTRADPITVGGIVEGVKNLVAGSSDAKQ